MTHYDMTGRLDLFAALEEYLRDERYDMAITLAGKRLDRNPDDLDAGLIIALCRVAMGNPEGASEILSEVETVLRQWSQMYRYLGDHYRKQGFIREAIWAYRRVLDLNPDMRTIKEIPEEFVSFEAELVSRAVSDDRKVTDVEGMLPNFYTVTLADLYIKQGHYSTARDVLKRIIKSEPDNADAHERLTLLETMAGKGRIKKEALVLQELTRWLISLRKRKDENG